MVYLLMFLRLSSISFGGPVRLSLLLLLIVRLLELALDQSDVASGCLTTSCPWIAPYMLRPGRSIALQQIASRPGVHMGCEQGTNAFMGLMESWLYNRSLRWAHKDCASTSNNIRQASVLQVVARVPSTRALAAAEVEF
jgi:hypothetical protein